MKVIVLGGNGMAGHMITAYLKYKKYDVISLTRNSLDVESEKDRTRFFYGDAGKDCDFIINCIGVLGPDSNKDITRTIFLNSWFPHYLENVYSNTKTKVIHISTDCVFNGKRGWYIETDTPNESNIYGRSKALGEINNDKDLTLRMSIIGTEIKDHNRSGLLNWVINNPKNEIQGWRNSIWSGITTLQLAKHIDEYMQKPHITGIYHLVPHYTISKYHLVHYINEVFECNKTIIEVPGKDENKSLLDTRNSTIFSPRPSYYEQLSQLREYSEKISA